MGLVRFSVSLYQAKQFVGIQYESSGLLGWVWDFRVEGGEIPSWVQIKEFISAVFF